jgi:hypothetical protein
MPWGSVTITYGPTGYTQNYKRNNVVTHGDCANLVEDAVTDSINRLVANGVPAAGLIVNRLNINQNMAADPGPNYRVI